MPLISLDEVLRVQARAAHQEVAAWLMQFRAAEMRKIAAEHHDQVVLMRERLRARGRR